MEILPDQSIKGLSSPHHRRARVERGPRSKSGCGTCITKKVKCDENRPICTRCRRLDLTCIWNPPKERLAIRRKGLGTLKNRLEGNWKSPTILPKDLDQTVAMPSSFAQETSLTTTLDRQTEDVSFSLDSITQVPSSSYQYSSMTSNIVSSIVASNPEIQDINTGQFLTEGFNFSLDVWDPFAFMPLDIPHIPQAAFNSVSELLIPDSSTTLGFLSTDPDDSDALLFFRTTFSSSKSTRSSIWSAHAVFFFQASQKKSALHFLLAVSHNEYALHCGITSSKSILPHKAREHYEKGSRLLLQHMTGASQPDHIGDLISFLYMYMFWMRRDTIYSERLRQISKGVVTYVKAHDIVNACVESACTTLSSNLSHSSSENLTEDPALVARLLVYLYDRDAYCSFFGCGGEFANYFDNNLEKRRIIWSISRTFLLRYWGKNYPRDEFIQDVEQARTYEMYFDLITICQRINNYSQDFERNHNMKNEEEDRRLRRCLDSHQVEHSLLFNLVAIHDSPRPKIPLLAYISVTFFYALQIYVLRSSSQSFGSTNCPNIDNALTSLISTAHLAMKVGPVHLLERFQWALLIAGIESKDIIHQEWISGSIADLGIRNILKAVLERKRKNGGQIPMSAIRQLLGGVTEPLVQKAASASSVHVD